MFGDNRDVVNGTSNRFGVRRADRARENRREAPDERV
jgi:hypothetical protein